MAKRATHPLTKQHAEQLTRIIASCDETEAYLKKCLAASIDVDAEARKNAEQREIAAAIKAQFFPNVK